MARITDQIKTVATAENAAKYQASEDPRAFCIDLMGINPSHANLDYFVEKMEAEFAKITGQSAPKSANPLKGNSKARYQMKRCPTTGTYVVNTEVFWGRTYGKCDRRTHSKHNTVYTQKQLRAFCRRHNIEICADDVARLPTAI